MNREKARELLPIIQAYADGEQVEIKSNEHSGWNRIPNPSFGGNENVQYRIAGHCCHCSEYRVKPKSKEFMVDKAYLAEVEGADILVVTKGDPAKANIIKVREVDE